MHFIVHFTVSFIVHASGLVSRRLYSGGGIAHTRGLGRALRVWLEPTSRRRSSSSLQAYSWLLGQLLGVIVLVVRSRIASMQDSHHGAAGLLLLLQRCLTVQLLPRLRWWDGCVGRRR